MKKIENYTTEMVLEDVKKYIEDNNITDDDMKQTLYLIGLDKFLEARNNGYKYSFSYYVAHNKGVEKIIKEYVNEEEIDMLDLDNVYYVQRIPMSNASDIILQCIHDCLNAREINVLYKRFVELKTLDATGKEYGVTRDRIRQIEAKALRKMRANSFYRAQLADMLNSNYINYPDFINKFGAMINGTYQPDYKKPSPQQDNNMSKPREKMVFYTGQEIKAMKEAVARKKAEQERLKIIDEIIAPIDTNDAYYFYYNSKLTGLDMITEAIERFNVTKRYIAGYVPTIEYLGTTTKGEKTFTLKCKGKHYKIYLREEVDTFVLEGDRNLVYDYKRVYGLKHNVNVIANYIADHYDEFGGNENE